MSSLVHKVFYNKEGQLVLAQKPNLPLIFWLIARGLQFFVSQESVYYDWLQVIALVSLSIWALLEMFLGINLFRRFLGVGVLFFLVMTKI